ncbi:MAG: TIM barrel protein [Verrucomicrobiae bacterium]|nr:TIM barrel protein [Verrucomicrobiae bacterium]
MIKTNNTTKLGIQSWALRSLKSNRTLAQQLRRWGVGYVELCEVHVDFKEPAGFDEAIAIYREAGVQIASIGVQVFHNEPTIERNYFEFARRAGATLISADFAVSTTPDCFRMVEKLAEEYDLRLAIHNHGGHHWLGNAQMLEHVFATTSERIGLCLDTAWALDAGENPIGMALKFRERLYSLHLKDFTFDSAGQPQDVVLGSGNLKLRELFTALRKADFRGFAFVEFEGSAGDPVATVGKCAKIVRAEWD